MQNKKILVTGATGQVGFPFAQQLAKDNEVWAIARFGDAEKKSQLVSSGVRCHVVDLCAAEFGDLPKDFDAVFHFAVARIDDDNFDKELTENAEATGALMAHCRDAGAFFHCSSTAVYEANGHEVFTESSPLGDNHRCMFATYSIGKIAVEAVVRFCAKAYNLPTVIARLNTPYGESGWPFYHLMMMQHGMEIPVHSDGLSQYTLIHQEDINRLAPALLEAASVPAAVYNFSGQDHVSIQEWTTYIGELTGFEAKLQPTDKTLMSVKTDNSKMQSVVGQTQVSWRDGIRSMVESTGLLKTST